MSLRRLRKVEKSRSQHCVCYTVCLSVCLFLPALWEVGGFFLDLDLDLVLVLDLVLGGKNNPFHSNLTDAIPMTVDKRVQRPNPKSLEKNLQDTIPMPMLMSIHIRIQNNPSPEIHPIPMLLSISISKTTQPNPPRKTVQPVRNSNHSPIPPSNPYDETPMPIPIPIPIQPTNPLLLHQRPPRDITPHLLIRPRLPAPRPLPPVLRYLAQIPPPVIVIIMWRRGGAVAD